MPYWLIFFALGIAAWFAASVVVGLLVGVAANAGDAATD